MPGGHGRPEKPLHQQPTSDLWQPLLFFPVCGGLLLSVTIVGPGRGIGPAWLAPALTVAVFGAASVALGGPRLAELARRGAWVPPGAGRHAYLTAGAIAAVLSGLSLGLLTGFVTLLEWWNGANAG